MTKQEELKRHAEVLKMKAEAIKDQEMVVEIESEIKALELPISPDELRLKTEGLDEMAESIKDQEKRAKLAAELEAEVKALELPISRNEIPPPVPDDDPSSSLSEARLQSLLLCYSKEERLYNAELLYHMKVKPEKQKDPWRILNLSDEEAIALMEAVCILCGRIHIRGQNNPNVIDRINSADPEYTLEKCTTLCNSCNTQKGSMTFPEYLNTSQGEWDNMPNLIQDWCRDGIDNEDDLRAYVEQEAAIDNSLISRGFDNGEINLHLATFPTSKKMTNVRKGVNFDKLFCDTDNEDEGMHTRAMVADVYTRLCTLCGLLCCSGANRGDNDLSYPENVRLGLLYSICYTCNVKLANYPIELHLYKSLQVRDHTTEVGAESILTRVDVPLPVLVREVELEGAFVVGGLACSDTLISIQTAQAEYSIASAIEYELGVSQELLPEDSKVVATLAMSNTLVKYKITFRGNINTLSGIQQSVEQTLTNNSTLESITATAFERSSSSSTLSSFTIIQNIRFNAHSTLVVKQMSGFTSPDDGLKFMTFLHKQRQPVLVEIALSEGIIKFPFKSDITAKRIIGNKYPIKKSVPITPLEYYQYLEDKPDVVVQFRNTMGVMTSLDGDFVSGKLILHILTYYKLDNPFNTDLLSSYQSFISAMMIWKT